MPKAPSLEAQLSDLAALGLALEQGTTIDDLLYSLSREKYEETPFTLLLCVLGGEVERKPWGRPFCGSVWNFDAECIEGSGAYVEIVNKLARVSGASTRLSNVTDEVDLEAKRGWVEYTLDGKRQRWDVQIQDDWADMTVVSSVMATMEEGGRRFYALDNGQAAVLFYLDERVAKQINGLSKHALKPAVGR